MKFRELIKPAAHKGGKAIASAARKTWGATKRVANSKPIRGMSGIVGSVVDAVKPRSIIEAAVSESPFAANLVQRYFDWWDNRKRGDEPKTTEREDEDNNSESNFDSDAIVAAIEQVDSDIVDLKELLRNNGRIFERELNQTFANQTMVLSRFMAPIIMANRSITHQPQFGGDIIEHNANQQLLTHNNSISRALLPAPANKANREISRILADAEDRNDDKVAEEQQQDIAAIRKILEKKDADEKNEKRDGIIDKLLDGDMGIGIGRRRRYRKTSGKVPGRYGRMPARVPAASPAGAMATRAPMLAAPAAAAATPAASTAGTALAGISGTAAAAIGSALLFGGTGLYAAVQAIRGEDSSNWLSNLVDKGVQKATGDDNASIGTKIYDALHDESGNNIVAKHLGIAEGQSTAEKRKNQLATALQFTPLAPLANTVRNDTTFFGDTQTITAAAEPETHSQQAMQAAKKEQQNAAQPIVIQQPHQAQQHQSPVPSQGGQELPPLITRPTDSTLRRVADGIISHSIWRK